MFFRSGTRKIQFCAAVNGHKNFNTYSDELPLNQWSRIFVAQIPYGENFQYIVEVNDVVLENKTNTEDRIFENVTAYLSNPWQKPASALIRNLTIQTFKNGMIVYFGNINFGNLGTHHFDLFCTSTHRLYFDLNLSSVFLAKLYFDQNYSICTSRPIRSPNFEKGRST